MLLQFLCLGSSSWFSGLELVCELQFFLTDISTSTLRIFWVLGRHDRAWGPERPVFGKVRYMTTESARRKLKLNIYINRWSENAPLPREIQR